MEKFSYVVQYEKKIGGTGFCIVNARSETEACKNAKTVRFSGKNFKVIKKSKPVSKSQRSGHYGK